MVFLAGSLETPAVACVSFPVDFAGGFEVWQAFRKIRSRQRKADLFILQGVVWGVPMFSKERVWGKKEN